MPVSNLDEGQTREGTLFLSGRQQDLFFSFVPQLYYFVGMVYMVCMAVDSRQPPTSISMLPWRVFLDASAGHGTEDGTYFSFYFPL